MARSLVLLLLLAGCKKDPVVDDTVDDTDNSWANAPIRSCDVVV